MRVIYVDDELLAREKFKLIAFKIEEIGNLEVFADGIEALEYVKKNIVDVAFLDMELPEISGIEVAQKLYEIDKNIRVIFITAFGQYALDAWKVNATGYIMKPYAESDIKKALEKCVFHPIPSSRIQIQTIPELALTVDGKPVHISGEKAREMFALLVDRAERGITTKEGIMYLWPERLYDNTTQSLFRVTYKRLVDALNTAGIGDIIASEGNRRYIKVEKVDCDVYRIFSGDKNTAKRYTGMYLMEYSWAEERNGQLYWMLMKNNEK